MPWCVVIKKFGGSNGTNLLVNQLVDIPDGTRLSQLSEQRYVRLATPKEIASAEDVEVEVDDAPPPPKTNLTVRRRASKKA